MKIDKQRHGAVTLLKPEGPLAAADVAEFAGVAKATMTQTLGRFAVDLTAVPFVDGQGLEALLDLTDALADSGKVLKLCGTNKTVRQAMELTELESLFDYFDDVNAVVRSFL